MTADTALRVGLIVAALFLLGGIASALVIRKLVGKLISLSVCALLALVVWSQRTNIRQCADNAALGDTNCHFLWVDVVVPSPADDLAG